MDKSSKKGTARPAGAPKASHKPLLSPKPNIKKTTKHHTTKSKQDTKRDNAVINSDEETVVKRERSLSDGSVKSLSWVCSESIEQDSASHMPAKRTRSNTTNKEMWMPLARTVEDTPKPPGKEERKVVKPSSPEPMKPPRPKRVNSFKSSSNDDKVEVKAKQRGKHKAKQDTSRAELDPVKPPRRKLPQTPTDSPEEERRKGKKGDSKKDEEFRDVISRPVVTSTPFQENMTLSVENLDEDNDGRRVFSIYDDSTDTTVQQGQSFYDFLYSKDDPGSTQAGAFSGSQMKDLGDDNIYDEVPLESSSQSLVSLGKRSSNHEFEIYDEVIINKGEDVLVLELFSYEWETYCTVTLKWLPF